jgi:hypothetical protein
MGFLTKEEYEDADIIDEKSAEVIRDEENAEARPVVDAAQMMQEGTPVEPEPEDKPDF